MGLENRSVAYKTNAFLSRLLKTNPPRNGKAFSDGGLITCKTPP
jgi:hypothetical protein